MCSTKYPKSIYFIMTVEFCERFSFCGLRTTLSLYLRDALHFSERDATILYHVFYALCYVVPIIGAIFADSFYGRYQTIRMFSYVYVMGNVLLCLGAIPILGLPIVQTTIVGLMFIGIGTGGIKPCVAALCGEQFFLPDQRLNLEHFFSLFFFTINVGGFLGMILIPLIRKTSICYGEDTCYALSFAVPALFMILALLLFLIGKPLYSIKCPKTNVILQFLHCSLFALKNKLRSHSQAKKSHWLDYAEGSYPNRLIADMKTVLAILFLFIPLPLFWSLFDQQGSSWTFQAARTDRSIFGFHILPDQLQVLNPLLSLFLIPIFEKCIYPCLDKCHILENPLRKMVWGGMIAGFAFLCAGYVEMDLQGQYPLLTAARNPTLIIVNALPCSVSIVNDINYLDEIGSDDILFYDNVAMGIYPFNAIIPQYCGHMVFSNETDNLQNFTLLSQLGKDSIFILAARGNTIFTHSFQDSYTLRSEDRRPILKVKALSLDLNYDYWITLKGAKSFQVLKVSKKDVINTFENVSLVGGTYEVEVVMNKNESNDHPNSFVDIPVKQDIVSFHDGVYCYLIYVKENTEIVNALRHEDKTKNESEYYSDVYNMNKNDFNEIGMKNGFADSLIDIDDLDDELNMRDGYSIESYNEKKLKTKSFSQTGGKKLTITNGEKEHNSGKSYQIFSKMFTLSVGKNVKMIYLLPQYILISIGEVMFAVAGLHFSFTQAPKAMKTVTIATWHLSVAIGNLIIIFVEQWRQYYDQATEFFLYASLMFADMLLFYSMTKKYKFVKIQTDESSSLLVTSSGNDDIFFNLNQK